MNYEANTHTWQIGDVVIHDADAKEKRMLMRVIGFTNDGLVKTVYVDQRSKQRAHKTWANELKYLHDPARFGLTERP